MVQRLTALEHDLAALEAELHFVREEARASREGEMRAARRARFAGVLCCSIIAAGGSFLAARPVESQASFQERVVSAPFTVISPRTGRPILKVVDGPNGGVLTMFDRAGGRMLQVADPPGTRGLTLFDAAGVPFARAGLRIGDQGAPRRTIEVFDTEGSPATRMETGVLVKTGNKFNSINVLEHGERVIELGIDPDDNQLGMSVQNNDDEPLLILGRIGDRVGIDIHDPVTFRQAVAIGVDAGIGGRGVSVFGATDNSLAQLGAALGDPTGGRLFLFNPAGVQTFSAPP